MQEFIRLLFYRVVCECVVVVVVEVVGCGGGSVVGCAIIGVPRRCRGRLHAPNGHETSVFGWGMLE